MKKLLFFLLTATPAFSQWSYSIYNASNTAFANADLSRWTNNGSIACSGSPCSVNGTTASGGALILPSATLTQNDPSDPTEYEVSMSIALKMAKGVSGGGFVELVHASSNALSAPGYSADAGTYDAVHLGEPIFNPDGSCTATLYYFERTSSPAALIYSTSVACADGMIMRTVAFGTNVWVMLNGQVYLFSSTLSGGSPGVGVYATPSGSGISAVQTAPRCTGSACTPTAVSASSFATSAFPNSVSLHWQEPVQSATVAAVGIGQQIVSRPGFWDYFDLGTDYTDATVSPGSSYQYNVTLISFHGVSAAATALPTVTTPPAGNIDPRRTGVKPQGSYWGGGGENIDMQSGNLNFTVPMLGAQGRGGWTVPFSLSYNSQNWRKDAGGAWKIGIDNGYGFGWKMMAGSLTPYWDNGSWGIDHYLFIDATGAEYRLYPQSKGATVWTSQLAASTDTTNGTPQSGEGIYVYYDANSNMLHFKDGSFWVMGCLSGGTEQDSGTMYPTIMEDRNGNQILVRYMTGLNASTSNSGNADNYSNSSGRIYEIEDTRAVANGSSPHHTYGFSYNTQDASGVPHINSIVNYIGTAEYYSFSTYLETVSDPFGLGATFPNTDILLGFWNTIPLTNGFSYNASGEMTVAYLPKGGYLRWTYANQNYVLTNETVTQRAVSNRYLAQDSSATAAQQPNNAMPSCTTLGQTNCEFGYTIQPTAPAASSSIIPQSCITDPSGPKRCWSFWTNTSALWELGLQTELTRISGAGANLSDTTSQWSQESTQSNAYISQTQTTLDAGSLAPVYTKSTQTIDAYGNALSSNQWDYSSSPPSGSATRAYVSTYKYYTTPLYVLNMLATTTLNSVQLVSNTYDSYSPALASLANNCASSTAICEHDSAFSTSFTGRGNVTQAATPSSTIQTSYDLTGTPVTVTDAIDSNNPHAVSVGTSSTSNYSAPTLIQLSTGQSEDQSLQSSYSYTTFLGVASATGPNGAQAFANYNSTTGRPTNSTAVTGAVTSYTYSSSPIIPYITTATTNTHWSQTTQDGLGRTVSQSIGSTTGGSSTTVSSSDTIYWPCGCSPMGKMAETSQAYAPGGNKVYTAYAFDGLGRTVSVTLPPTSGTSGNAGKTTYLYMGNWTTLTDPAGNWKEFEKDVFGNIVAVVEPDPAAPPTAPVPPTTTAAHTLVTFYTYDPYNHLTGVSMTRSVSGSNITQTRSFTYNAKLQLASTSNPESGTSSANGSTQYAYNLDGTLHTRTDPKGQVTTYTYDKYKRVTTVQHGSGTSQTLNYTYDQGTNGAGRLTSVSMGPITGGCNAFSETYGYDIPGHTVSKNISIPYSGCSQVSMQGSWTYDTEGKLSTVTYPGPNGSGPTVTYTYDLMSRPYSASDVEGNSTPGCGSTPPGGSVTWAQSAAYTPAGQLGALTRLYSVSANCSGLSTSPFNEVWYFNNLNQTTEIDVSGIPYFPEPYLARYYYRSTNDNGQITSMDDGRLNYTIGYQYDALKRLVNASATGHWTQSYSYDGFGNLTAKTVPSGSAEPSFPGVNSAKNWLTGVTYDANGNTTTGIGNQTLSYDIENRLIQSTVGTASTVYGYDEANHRIAKTSGTNNPIVYFYGPDGKLMASFAATSLGLQSSSYRIYFGGMLLGTTTSSGSGGSALADRLGTYNPGYPYGTDAGLYGVPPDDAPYFATYTKDAATGFEYANNRYYSAGYGRFLTIDPSYKSNPGDPASPQSWNLYAYTTDDPANRTDPRGLSDCAVDDDVSCGPLTDDDDFDDAYSQLSAPNVGFGWKTNAAALDSLENSNLIAGWVNTAAGLDITLTSPQWTAIAGICIAQPELCVLVGGGAIITIYVANKYGPALVQAIEKAADHPGTASWPPCDPPEGTIGYREDKVPPSRRHYPFNGDHIHLFIVNQNKATGECYWNKFGVTEPPPPAGAIYLGSGPFRISGGTNP